MFAPNAHLKCLPKVQISMFASNARLKCSHQNDMNHFSDLILGSTQKNHHYFSSKSLFLYMYDYNNSNDNV